MEAEGASGDGSDLAVERLCASIAEPGGNDGDDAFEVFADGGGHSLEGRQPTTSGPTVPFFEFLPDLALVAAA